MILEKLETDFFLGKQADEIEKLLRRNRAGAFFFHLRFAGGADAQLEVGGGDRQAVSLRFEKKIREDGDCGLALDDALRQLELSEKVELLHAEFHVGLSSRLAVASVTCFRFRLMV